MAEPLYSVGTWDGENQSYTPDRLSVPAFNITLAQLRQSLRELRQRGYSAHRRRCPDGARDDNDPAVLVERTDGKNWKEIRRGWRRYEPVAGWRAAKIDREREVESG